MSNFAFEINLNYWTFGIGIYKDSKVFAIHILCFVFGIDKRGW